jgi:ParB family chromosome partitioning protein
MAAKKTASPKKTTRKPRRKKAEPASRGLSASEVGSEKPADGVALSEHIEADGGSTLAIYREPLAGHTVVLAALPLDKVEPTPYQRDLSEPHVKRLANAMERMGRYLDPIISVRKDGKYWTPNGNHRLGASKLLGSKAIISLVLPDEDAAYQILALNTEKAHNLKERSLEVIRMYRGLVGAKAGKETEFSHLFEEPTFPTLGAAYEKRPRLSGAVYNPILKRLETFLDSPLDEALALRETRADKVLGLDDAVVAVVDKLKSRGLVSPYLKNFVIARVNYLRFKKGDPSDFDFDETIDKLSSALGKFNVERVQREDVARMGGGPVEAED